MVEAGTLLTGTAPIEERINRLCRAAAYVLEADQLMIFLEQDGVYLGAYEYGMSEDDAAKLGDWEVTHDREILGDIEATDHYLLLTNETGLQTKLSRVPGIEDMSSAILAPLTHPNGARLRLNDQDFVAIDRDRDAKFEATLRRTAHTILSKLLSAKALAEVLVNEAPAAAEDEAPAAAEEATLRLPSEVERVLGY